MTPGEYAALREAAAVIAGMQVILGLCLAVACLGIGSLILAEHPRRIHWSKALLGFTLLAESLWVLSMLPHYIQLAAQR